MNEINYCRSYEEFEDEVIWEIYERKYELALARSELFKDVPIEINGKLGIRENLSY